MFVLLPLYIVSSAVGLALLRMTISSGQTPFALLANWRFLLGGLLYLIGFALWLLLLRRFELSFIFPLAAGALFVATTALGIVWLHETCSVWRMVGAGLIVAGITVVCANA